MSNTFSKNWRRMALVKTLLTKKTARLFYAADWINNIYWLYLGIDIFYTLKLFSETIQIETLNDIAQIELFVKYAHSYAT